MLNRGIGNRIDGKQVKREEGERRDTEGEFNRKFFGCKIEQVLGKKLKEKWRKR